MTINLQNKVIYGPVNSRRLGSSLGINVLSTEKKICNLNCVYCQYGWTKIKPDDLLNRNNFIDSQNILESVEKALFALSPSPQYITLSGNGEATLHPDFNEIVEGIVRIRNNFSTKSKNAILSNSMRVMYPKTRDSLSKLDVRIMKFDCGEEKLFKLYNRPVIGTSLDSIVNGLSNLDDVTIQALFTSGDHGNSNENHIGHWIEKIQTIKPIDIQIYTLDRGYPSDKIYPVTLDWLHDLAQRLNKLGFKSKAYS